MMIFLYFTVTCDDLLRFSVFADDLRFVGILLSIPLIAEPSNFLANEICNIIPVALDPSVAQC